MSEWVKVRISLVEVQKLGVRRLLPRLRELGINTAKPFTQLDDMTSRCVVFAQRRA